MQFPSLSPRNQAIINLLTTSLFVAAMLFCAVLLALRYWLLPNIGDYRDRIASEITLAVGQPVSIGEITADWAGLRPRLSLKKITVYEKRASPEPLQAALQLNRIEAILSWLTLLSGDIRFHEIAIDRPDLAIRRDRAGIIHVAGMPLNAASSESGFADWLLRQHRLIISDAAILWQDDLRAAPPLHLEHVSLRLENAGQRHRFGLRATPPRALASTLEVRGDLIEMAEATATANTTVGEVGINPDLQGWRGQLYTQLDYADIKAWRTWLPFPDKLALSRGAGGLRLWLEFEQAAARRVTADIRLQHLKTRLAQNVPELDLHDLQGRVSWQQLPDGFEVSSEGLSATAQNGLKLPAADFLLRSVAAAKADGANQTASGELRANTLDFDALAGIAVYLPLPASLRARLDELALRGRIHDLQATWSGWGDEQNDPNVRQRYRIKGRAIDLGMNARGAIPAFSGLSGTIAGNEEGGEFSLDSRQVKVFLPKVFHEPLAFDVLTAQAGWKSTATFTELKLDKLSFSNAHADGTLNGSYRAARGQDNNDNVIDLTGKLTRGDARFVARYMPLVVGQPVHDWLAKALLAGESGDVRLRLKGHLADFPFDGMNENQGIFEVKVKAAKVKLDYVAGWPKIDDIYGDLLFRGNRMEVHAHRATIFGVKLSKVSAVIADLQSPENVIEIGGEAHGGSNDFLKYIAQSPVSGYLDDFTKEASALGEGKLSLKLILPLSHLDQIKVSGSYQFANNMIAPGGFLPVLEKAQGLIRFTESTLSLENGSAQMLGGPVTIRSNSRPDGGVRMSIQGKADFDNLYRLSQTKGQVQGPALTNAATSVRGGQARGPAPTVVLPVASSSSEIWTRYLRGSADWRGVIDIRKKFVETTLDSTLRGVSSDLPAPFNKAAADVSPLKFENKFEKKGSSQQQEVLTLSYGKIMMAQILRVLDHDGQMRALRGNVSFGSPAMLPGKPGLVVSGLVSRLELDRWRDLLAEVNEATEHRSEGVNADVPTISGINLRVGELDFLGRSFSNLAVLASLRGAEWRASVVGREVNGEVIWLPQGKGTVVARLKNLTLPDTPFSVASKPHPEIKTQEKDLPALDVMAESFVMRQKQMGKLELKAAQQAQNWRVEKLQISNPDGVFNADGLWQSRISPPRIEANVEINATDIGKLLARLGYVDGVKRGSGKLAGKLSWSGGPQAIDYPTLSGKLKLEANRGQFNKLEPGIGKLLGILSLQALPRRITLDFRDVFSDGFEFDEISGNANITRGVAVTEDLKIEGSAAKVNMRGEINLVEETQNLKVRILPSLGQGASLAGSLIGGPVAGIATMIVSKILKDPLDRLAAYEYNVTGTWAEPNVVKQGSGIRNQESGTGAP